MSPRRAPIALRMPISRVRSVTVTSMMFMMPMPPTSREMAATAPSSTVKTWFVDGVVCQQRRLVQDPEVRGAVRGVGRREDRRRLGLGRVHLVRRLRLMTIWLRPLVRR